MAAFYPDSDMPKVLERKLNRKAKKRGLSKKLAQLMGSVTEADEEEESVTLN